MDIIIKHNMGLGQNQVWITVENTVGHGVIILPGEKTLEEFAYLLLEKVKTVKGDCATCGHSIEHSEYECDSNKMHKHQSNNPNPTNEEIQTMEEEKCPCWEINKCCNKKDDPQLFE